MEFKVFEQEWFTTPVWECPVSGINNKSIKDYCLKVRKEKPGVQISNRGGWRHQCRYGEGIKTRRRESSRRRNVGFPCG